VLQSRIPIQAFFDESGKFQNQQSISFLRATRYEGIDAFVEQRDQLLIRAGLQTLSMKAALRFDVPLSMQVQRIGLTNRIHALMPFIEYVRT
jgi:hypothetical protein